MFLSENNNERFAELRWALAEPNPENWQNIAKILDQWHANRQDNPQDTMDYFNTVNYAETMNYVKEHLEEWPDELKEYPAREFMVPVYPIIGRLEELLNRPSD